MSAQTKRDVVYEELEQTRDMPVHELHWLFGQETLIVIRNGPFRTGSDRRPSRSGVAARLRYRLIRSTGWTSARAQLLSARRFNGCRKVSCLDAIRK